MLLLDHTTPSDYLEDSLTTNGRSATLMERHKIWDLPDLQCAVVGTCLTLQECRRLVRRAKLALPEEASDYLVHSALVRCCRDDCRTARLVQKHLDRKFLRHIRQSLRTNNDTERRALWNEAAIAGDIPGPFWAMVTHPDLGQQLFSDIFGHVHMLSHLVGASNRADIRRLQRQETKLAEAEASIATLKRAYRSRIRDLSKRNRELASAQKVAQPKSSSLAFQQLFESLRLAQAERAEALRLVESMERKVERMEAAMAEMTMENDVLEGEVARLLEAQARLRCPREDGEGGCHGHSPCPNRSLGGKCILYVGGRSGMMPHYRELVESLGGQFVHHDGGREQHVSRLHQMLPGADAVLCPMDCVSHEAFHCVKNACRQNSKPCLAMRSASLSSLSKTLEGLLEAPSAPELQGESQ